MTTNGLAKVTKYLDEHQAEFEKELFDLLRIPSVSAVSERRGDVRRAAQWVEKQFASLKFEVDLIDTPGHPVVLARSPNVPDAVTVLVYGHYDVQPPEPLAEWITPPFEPTVRDGKIFARGSTDDKGQMFTHIKSAQAWTKVGGGLPVNLLYLIEGEEEIGSSHLDGFIAENKDRLACDVAVISDTAQFAPEQPAITYGLKGLVYFELRLRGPKQDLHSGTFGGTVTNPATSLARMLSALVDGKGRVQIPGFYDDVVALTADERKKFAALGEDEAEFMRSIGVSGMWGEDGYSPLERRWARPTFDVNGLASGWQGEGAKTVLPAQAMAKFSFRLVPRQDPAKVRDALEAFLKKLCPPGIEMELISFQGAPGVVVSLDSPYMEAAVRAVEAGFGRRPVFIREGGSIPVVSTFHDSLGVDTLLLGWGQKDDNAHSPNEKFAIVDFHRGIKASACLWHELSQVVR